MSKTEQQQAVVAAIGVLEATGIDVRLSEYWRGGERVYSLVMVNLHELGVERDEDAPTVHEI